MLAAIHKSNHGIYTPYTSLGEAMSVSSPVSTAASPLYGSPLTESFLEERPRSMSVSSASSENSLPTTPRNDNHLITTDMINPGEKVILNLESAIAKQSEKPSSSQLLGRSGIFKNTISLSSIKDNFHTRAQNFIKQHENITNVCMADGKDNGVVDFSSCVKVPASIRESFGVVINQLQELVNAGELCNKFTEKLVIYNFQPFAIICQEHPAYSVDMLIKDINDPSGKMDGESKTISVVVLSDLRVVNENTYWTMLEEADLEAQPEQTVTSSQSCSIG